MTKNIKIAPRLIGLITKGNNNSEYRPNLTFQAYLAFSETHNLLLEPLKSPPTKLIKNLKTLEVKGSLMRS